MSLSDLTVFWIPPLNYFLCENVHGDSGMHTGLFSLFFFSVLHPLFLHSPAWLIYGLAMEIFNTVYTHSHTCMHTPHTQFCIAYILFSYSCLALVHLAFPKYTQTCTLLLAPVMFGSCLRQIWEDVRISVRQEQVSYTWLAKGQDFPPFLFSFVHCVFACLLSPGTCWHARCLSLSHTHVHARAWDPVFNFQFDFSLYQCRTLNMLCVKRM